MMGKENKEKSFLSGFFGKFLGEKLQEAIMLLAGLFFLGLLAANDYEKWKTISISVLATILLMAFVIFFFDLMDRERERAAMGYTWAALLIIGLGSLGINLSTLSGTAVGGAKMIGAGVISAGSGVVEGVTSSTNTTIQPARNDLSEDVKKFSGNIPIKPEFRWKDGNAAVAGNKPGAREWCSEVAQEAGYNINKTFAAACGAIHAND